MSAFTGYQSRLAGAFLIFIGLCLPVGAAVVGRTAEQELRQACQELLDAVASGDVDVWKKYIGDEIVHIDENGDVKSKDELLQELKPLPEGVKGGMAIDRFHAEFSGNVAVAAYEMQETLDYHGQLLHSRFRATDTWLKTPRGLRLIARQVTAVLKDPPAIKLPREQLCAYDGTYALTADIEVEVRCTATGLSMERTGQAAEEYLPETADVFFAPGQPRTRRLFVRDAEGRVVAMLDRREGEDVRWTRKP